MMLARDVSNYTVQLTPAMLGQWKDAGVGLVIIQCFPASYHQYIEQREQMRLCAQEGLTFDAYIYDYLGDPTWLDGALKGLRKAFDEEGLLPRQIWLDEEDVETERGWSTEARVARVTESALHVGAWSREYAILAPGIYTAAWWWVPKTGNSTVCGDLDLWDADYDNQADTEASWQPYGGWSRRAIKQYAGSQPDGTDLNVLSVAEESDVEGTGEPEPMPVDEGWQAKKDAVVQAAGELQVVADQIEAAAKRKFGPVRGDILPLAAAVRARAERILA